jgi:hypothetical protein
MSKALLALIAALPEIIEMIKHLQRLNDQAEADRKVKDDIRAINKAFEDKDADALIRIFHT